jgi:hypothetical protein
LVLLSWSIVTDSDNPPGPKYSPTPPVNKKLERKGKGKATDPEDILEEMGVGEEEGGGGSGQVDDNEEPLVRSFIFFALSTVGSAVVVHRH